jgi:S1-C subfamily serine protease
VSWLDLVILGLLGLTVLNGYRRGAIMQAFSWGGFMVGFFVGLYTAPPLVRQFNFRGPAKSVAGFVGFLVIAFIVEAIIAVLGARLVRRIAGDAIRKPDRVIGSVLAGLILLLTVWLATPSLKRIEGVAVAVKESKVIAFEYAVLSDPPNFTAVLGGLFSHTGFPDVFAQLNPSLAPGVDPAPKELANNKAIRAAARLTFKIESSGCGGRVDGSGFPARNDTVITAAHVVAGTKNTHVLQATDGGGRRFAASVVYLNSDTDIAVLHVPGLTDALLEVQENAAARGTDGAAIGYPGGGDRKISVARVRARTEAVGYDIYSKHRVSREIYVLRARVIQGNSGGPFVDAQGDVRGMIFAASAQNKEESYALTETEIFRALSRAGSRTRQVKTGSCAL